MPRIPEGKFRTEPSSRVPSVANTRIDAGDTQRIRSLGKQFIGISDKMQEAKRTAEALNSADKVDQDYTNTLGPAFEQYARESVNGKIKDPTTGKEVSYSQAVSDLIEKHNSRAIASFGTDTEALAYYNKYTRPKMERELEKARVFENTQIVDHRNKTISKDSELLVQRYIDGENIDLDLAAHSDKILAAKNVISTSKAEEHLSTTYKNLAYQAPNLIKNKGFNKENDATARKYFKYLSEAERRHVEREYNNTVEQVKRLDVEQRIRDNKNVVAKIESFKDFRPAINKLQEIKNKATKSPIDINYETPSERLNQISDAVGKEMQFTVLAMTNGTGTREELNNLATQYYDEHLSRTIAGDAVNQLGADNVREAILNKAFQNFSSTVSSRDSSPTGAFDLYADINGHLLDDIKSGDSRRVEMGLNGLNNYYNKANVPIGIRSIVGKEQSEEFGKAWKDLAQGDADPTGQLQLNLIDSFTQQYGDYSSKAIHDMIKLGGGTKGGETHIPSVTALAVRLPKDDIGRKLAKEMFAHKNTYEDNLNRIIENKDGFSVSSKADFERQVGQSIADSPLDSLYNGRNAENNHIYQAQKDAIMHRAAWYMAKDKSNLKTAIEKSMGDFSDAIRVGNYESSNVLVDSKFIKKFPEADSKRLTDMSKQLTQLKHLDKLGVEIDFKSMMVAAKNNAFLAKNMKTLQVASAQGYEKARETFTKAFGDNIMVVNDPHNPNAVKFYLRSTNGEPIPILTKVTQKGRLVPSQPTDMMSQEPQEPSAAQNMVEFMQPADKVSTQEIPVTDIQVGSKELIVDLSEYYPHAKYEYEAPEREAKAKRSTSRSAGGITAIRAMSQAR